MNKIRLFHLTFTGHTLSVLSFHFHAHVFKIRRKKFRSETFQASFAHSYKDSLAKHKVYGDRGHDQSARAVLITAESLWESLSVDEQP